MDGLSEIKQYINESINTKVRLLEKEDLLEDINFTAQKLISILKKGNKILIAGNGGSAADAQHIAAEFVSRFFYDRPGLPAIALTTDTSMLTAIGNDYGFDKLFSRQVDAQGIKGDVFIGITTSGDSENILRAVELAKLKGIFTVGLCGEAGKLRNIAETVISVPSKSTPFIQESHIMIGHVICKLVEQSLFPR